MSDKLAEIFIKHSQRIVGNQISEQKFYFEHLEKAVREHFAKEIELAVNTAPADELMPVGEFFNENKGE